VKWLNAAPRDRGHLDRALRRPAAGAPARWWVPDRSGA